MPTPPYPPALSVDTNDLRIVRYQAQHYHALYHQTVRDELAHRWQLRHNYNQLEASTNRTIAAMRAEFARIEAYVPALLRRSSRVRNPIVRYVP